MAMINALADSPRMGSVQCVSPVGLHRMAYREWGSHENPRVLICVHGLTRIGSDFDDLARALKGEFRVILPDVVGRGASSWLTDPMLYGIPQYVSDMVTLIARLNVSSVHWVGTSMGGLIGMTLASLPNSPIERLVLNDVGAILKGEALARIAAYVGQKVTFTSREEAYAVLKTIFAGFGPHTDAQWEHLLHPMIKPISQTAIDAKNSETKGFELHYDPAIATPFRKTYAQELESGKLPADLDLWSIYDRITTPTILLRGAQSDLLTAQTAREMEVRGPKARLVEFQGVGHAPTLMHADQIAVVKEFLSA